MSDDIELLLAVRRQPRPIPPPRGRQRLSAADACAVGAVSARFV